MSCSTAPRAPLSSREQAMRPGKAPELADDLPLEGLAAGLEAQAQIFERSIVRSDVPAQDLVFGARRISPVEYARGMRRLAELARQGKETFLARVPEEFEFYETYGQESWGDGFFTGYYELNIEGALKRTARFTQPIYGRPRDLLELDLSKFGDKYATDRKMRVRVDETGGRVVPYFTRAEIDGADQPLRKSKRAEILCWLDPIDAFFLQVQGSGVVRLGGGKTILLNYAEKNGAQYHSVAKFLKGKIATDDLNMHVLENYLRSLKPDELQVFLNQNPSYIFFKKGDVSAVTSSGASATDGRTAAIDPRYFPLGAVAFIQTERPVEPAAQPEGGAPVANVPPRWEAFSRFMLGQDTGGAITGGGRMDIFFGRDGAAKYAAGMMKRRGKIWFLAPKPTPAVAPSTP